MVTAKPRLTPSAVALIAGNSIPILGVLFLGWDVFALVFPDWLEDQGLETPLKDDDRLMIVPSVAGGLAQVDHAALCTNQAFIIGLNLLAFILDLPWLAALVALAMAVGTAMRLPAFGFVYQRFFKPRGWVKPDLLEDNPEPHRFAQGMGAAVLAAGALALFAGSVYIGMGAGMGGDRPGGVKPVRRFLRRLRGVLLA